VWAIFRARRFSAYPHILTSTRFGRSGKELAGISRKAVARSLAMGNRKPLIGLN
jgi:hypothetical protein